MAKHDRSSCMREVFFALCKSVNTPFSLGAWIRFKSDHKLLLDLEINPANYEDAETFAGDYSVISFLSKWKGLVTGYDLEAEALQKFRTSEARCLETNNRLRDARLVPTRFDAVIFAAQKKIARLLGPFSRFKVMDSYGWGPGATSSIPRRSAFVDTKLIQTPISVTRRSLDVLRQEIGGDLHWSSVLLGVSVSDIVGSFCLLPSLFSVSEECVIDTVPKNSKTHRVIAKEHTGNGFLQKGFGAYMRKRLKTVGVDLDNQGLNQDAAKAAYWQGFATLDLKAASDTVAKELVFGLLPVDWALALDDARSHKAILPKSANSEVITLEKFSSMGNGFTFELESLIFWALTSAVLDVYLHRKELYIYGDDIICPSEAASQLIEVLDFCGFEVNTSKSFISGNFYESCGKHYFKGCDVTPVYQKEELNEFYELIRLGNRLIRLAYRLGQEGNLDKRFFPAWSAAWRRAGASSRFQIPFGEQGDDGWCLPASYFVTRPQDINLGIHCVVLSSPSRCFPACEGALLAWSLRRGVCTESAFAGNVSSAIPLSETKSPREGRRWVMPSGEFGLDW